MGIFQRRRQNQIALEVRSAFDQIVQSVQDAQTYGEDDALTVPAVYSAVTLIADGVGALPAYARDNEVGRLDEQPGFLEQPQPGWTWPDWASTAAMGLAIRGNLYLHLDHLNSDGYPRILRILHPDEVSVEWDRKRLNPVYKWRDQPMTLGVDFDHIPLNREPGSLKGLSPVEVASRTISGAVGADKYAAEFWANGAVPTGWLEVPQNIDPNDAQKFKDSFSAGQATRSPAVLSGGVKYHAVSFSPSDAAWLDARAFSVVEIARIWKLPAPLLQASLPSGSSIVYQNFEALSSSYVRHALDPILNRLEAHLTRYVPGRKYVQFDRNELLRGDFASRFTTYQIGLDAGILTHDEVRGAEGWPSIDSPQMQEATE